MLDLNQLYINAEERNDATTGLGKNDVAITEDFYKLNKQNDKIAGENQICFTNN